jgi:D-glycero-alpha-D-manno-heptose-7-phosphate kinase
MIITQTPLRISFAGGGTDFRDFWKDHDGAVVSSAINKYIYVIVKERFDDLIVLNYSKREIANSVDEIQHDLIRESMKKAGVTKKVEITTLADIPSQGSGLGSSSSMTVGLLHALYSYRGEPVATERLAQEACEIEIDRLGRPIGIQDQYIASYGGIRFFVFHRDGRVSYEKLNLSADDLETLNSRLILFYLNRTRKSSSVLEEQKNNMNRNREILVVLKNYATRLAAELPGGDLDVLGELMHRGWNEKKKLASRVTDSKIDAIYQRALEAGALGGKVTGAGGGGFLLLYVQNNKRERISQALKDFRELPFALEPEGSRVIFRQK